MSDDRTRASYVGLVAALRDEFGPAALEAIRIQLLPHQYNRTSLGTLVQAVRDAGNIAFEAPTGGSGDVDNQMQETYDRVCELENQLGIEQSNHEHTRHRLRQMERERDDLDYQLRDTERQRDDLRAKVSDLESQLHSARREADTLRCGWR